MGFALTAALAFCLWVVMWGLGSSGLDGILVTLVILVIAATVKSLGKFVPGASDRRKGASGGW